MHPPAPTARATDAHLTLLTFGGARLARASVPVLPAGKPVALLAYLAAVPGRSASRDHLTDLLWSDRELEPARHAFRQTLWYIRRKAGDDILQTDGVTVRLRDDVVSDRDAFLAAIESGDFEAAIQLYAGDFLPGFAAPGGAQFEQWADAERRRLRANFVCCAEMVVRRHLASSHSRDAITLARRVRDTDPESEAAWRLLLEALIAGEDLVNAAAEADQLERRLANEQVDPEPATRAALRIARQATPAHGTPAHGTPAQPTGITAELIGREEEFAAILAAWDDARVGRARHLHLEARAGIGKTRLLTSVHARLRAARHRVVLVRAYQGGQGIPYSFASDLASDLAQLPGARGISPAAASALVALHPSLSTWYHAAADDARDDEALRRRAVALHELVGAIAEDAPLALLLDDLHWVDLQSRAMLLRLLEHLGPERLLVVTAARGAVGDRLITDHTGILALHPLDLQQVGALVASIASLPTAPWADQLPAQLLDATRGSPLLLMETLHFLLEREQLRIAAGVWSAPDPGTLATALHAGSALRARVTALPAPARDALRYLAAAAGPVEEGVLAATCPGPGLDHALAELEHRGLAVRVNAGWEASHDEIATAALDSSTPTEIEQAHRRLAYALLQGGVRSTPRAMRAADHLLAAREYDALTGLFADWHGQLPRAVRRDRAACARYMLGEDASPERVWQLANAVPFRRRPQFWQGIAAIAALLAVSAPAAIDGRPRSIIVEQGHSAELLVAWQEGSVRYARVAIDEELLQRSPVIDAREWVTPDPAWRTGVGAIASPDGRTVAYFHVDRPGEGLELYVAPIDGAERRLTNNPHDDVPWAWSPNGRYVAFHSGRWSARAYAQVGVIDAHTGALRRITRSDGTDSYPRWSPDGTRIAFTRRFMDEARPDQLCWVTVNGVRERCLALHGFLSVAPVAFVGSNRVLAAGDTGSGTMLVSVDLRDGATSIVDRRVGTRLASTDGRWIACLCSDGDGAPQLIVHPADHPERARAVSIHGRPASGLTLLWRTRGHLPFIERMSIEGPAAVTVGGTARLRIAARDSSGTSTALPGEVLLWSSDDTSVVTMDSAGVVHARREGLATVHASAGGWRGASHTVRVTHDSSRVVMRENWSQGIAAQFLRWGDPKPILVRDAAGKQALLVNGDDSFSSGVILKTGLDGSRGVGVRARLSLPVRRPAWQALSLALDGGIDERALARWDGHAGTFPVSRAASCTLSYPNGEGMTGLRAFRSTAGVLPAPASVRDGHWITVDLQLLPDGRCAVAIDGVPRAVSRAPIPLDRPFRLVLSGQSVGARMLVGPLELWQGVRSDVDWSLLDAQPMHSSKAARGARHSPPA